MGRLTGLLGIVVILAVAWLFSSNRKAIKPRILIWGLGLQFGFALLVLDTHFGDIFQGVSKAVTAMLGYSEAGASFLFGDTLGRSSGSSIVRGAGCPAVSALRSSVSLRSKTI